MIISTSTLMKALGYYHLEGFTPMDVPLIVDREVSNHTKPKGVPDLSHDCKVYIGSAEQSFIQLHKDGKLPDSKYMAVTPCYRHERYLDEFHYLMFMKLELIHVGTQNMVDLSNMIDICQRFFDLMGKETTLHRTNKMFEYDLTTDYGLELGSYGKREMLDGTPYLYGTGCAFPRISL